MSYKSNKKNDQRKRRDYRPPKAETTPKTVPLLTHGPKTNYALWKEAIRGEIAMEYGLLVSIMDSGELLYPGDVDVDDYDPDADPHGFVLSKLKSEISNREKHVERLNENQPKCRALMWKHMSRESQEAVIGHADYDEHEHRNDCLQLALSIEATHQGGGAHNAAVRRSTARQMYRSVRQGPTQGCVDYKADFTFKKKGL